MWLAESRTPPPREGPPVLYLRHADASSPPRRRSGAPRCGGAVRGDRGAAAPAAGTPSCSSGPSRRRGRTRRRSAATRRCGRSPRSSAGPLSVPGSPGQGPVGAEVPAVRRRACRGRMPRRRALDRRAARALALAVAADRVARRAVRAALADPCARARERPGRRLGARRARPYLAAGPRSTPTRSCSSTRAAITCSARRSRPAPGGRSISHTELPRTALRASRPRPVLEAPYHLSYPFVFAHGGEVFMIPETSSQQTGRALPRRRLPRASGVGRAMLLDGLVASDATLFEHEGRLWLFVGVAAPGATLLDELHLFHPASLLGPWLAAPAQPGRLRRALRAPGGRDPALGGAAGAPGTGLQPALRRRGLLPGDRRAEHRATTPSTRSRGSTPASSAAARATHTYTSDGQLRGGRPAPARAAPETPARAPAGAAIRAGAPRYNRLNGPHGRGIDARRGRRGAVQPDRPARGDAGTRGRQAAARLPDHRSPEVRDDGAVRDAAAPPARSSCRRKRSRASSSPSASPAPREGKPETPRDARAVPGAVRGAAGPDQQAGEASPQYLSTPRCRPRSPRSTPTRRSSRCCASRPSFLRSFHGQMLHNRVETEKDFQKAMELEPRRRRGELLPRGCNRQSWLLYSDQVRYAEQLSQLLRVLPARAGAGADLRGVPSRQRGGRARGAALPGDRRHVRRSSRWTRRALKDVRMQRLHHLTTSMQEARRNPAPGRARRAGARRGDPVVAARARSARAGGG